MQISLKSFRRYVKRAIWWPIPMNRGGGFPDIVVGCRGLTIVGNFDINYIRRFLETVTGAIVYDGAILLYEIKDGDKPPSARRLNEREQTFHKQWSQQPVFVVSDFSQALYRAGVTVMTDGYDKGFAND